MSGTTNLQQLSATILSGLIRNNSGFKDDTLITNSINMAKKIIEATKEKPKVKQKSITVEKFEDILENILKELKPDYEWMRFRATKSDYTYNRERINRGKLYEKLKKRMDEDK